MDYSDGAWRCVNHFECTRVCPRKIPVMESINVIKREIEQNVRLTGYEKGAAAAKTEEGDLSRMSAQETERIFTEEEIGKYTGQDGKPIYIAFQGKVYDVTESFMWTGGTHMAEHQAGKDLTDEIENAPHGNEVFERYPQVGVLRKT